MMKSIGIFVLIFSVFSCKMSGNRSEVQESEGKDPAIIAKISQSEPQNTLFWFVHEAAKINGFMPSQFEPKGGGNYGIAYLKADKKDSFKNKKLIVLFNLSNGGAISDLKLDDHYSSDFDKQLIGTSADKVFTGEMPVIPEKKGNELDGSTDLAIRIFAGRDDNFEVARYFFLELEKGMAAIDTAYLVVTQDKNDRFGDRSNIELTINFTNKKIGTLIIKAFRTRIRNGREISFEYKNIEYLFKNYIKS